MLHMNLLLLRLCNRRKHVCCLHPCLCPIDVSHSNKAVFLKHRSCNYCAQNPSVFLCLTQGEIQCFYQDLQDPTIVILKLSIVTIVKKKSLILCLSVHYSFKEKFQETI